MIDTLSGLQIEPDGTTTGVAVPSGVALYDWMRREFNGAPDVAHYGTWDHAVCVVVHETGATDGLAVNVLATVLVEELIRRDLGYRLYGTAYLFGYERPGVAADLRDETRVMVESVAARVVTRRTPVPKAERLAEIRETARTAARSVVDRPSAHHMAEEFADVVVDAVVPQLLADLAAITGIANARQRPHPRRDLLLAAMISDGGEWTTGKVKSLYAGHNFGHMYRATLRSDLGTLHQAGLIVRHDVNGRRFYTAADQDGGK